MDEGESDTIFREHSVGRKMRYEDVRWARRCYEDKKTSASQLSKYVCYLVSTVFINQNKHFIFFFLDIGW
jgi:hypothetical protein